MEYSAARLEALTLREAVVRRPAMYFGDYPTADWPLVIGAWTAFDLLDYGVGPQRSVELILHRDGGLSAAVVKGRVAWPVTARPAPVDELVRRRMWWHQLGRSTAVTVLRDGGPADHHRTRLASPPALRMALRTSKRAVAGPRSRVNMPAATSSLPM